MRQSRMLAAVMILAVYVAGARAAAAQEAADPACPPEVQEALEAAAEAGAGRSMALVRSPEVGIREPEGLLDLSCLQDLWRVPYLDVLATPGGIESLFGLLERTVCRAARSLYRENIARPLRRGIYRDAALTVLPGLAPQDRPQREPAAPSIRLAPQGGNSDAFRGLLGDPE